jgi:hypothetical protein
MRRGAIILTAVSATVTCIGASALAWHLSEPWRERRAFINKCLANKFTEATCACTYSAHKELRPSYAVLVKSIVHDDMTTFATNTSVMFGRTTLRVGTGIDPSEISSALRVVEGNKTVGSVLRETGKFLERHKYKAIGTAIGGVSAAKVMAIYRAGRAGIEVSAAAYTVEKHCGIVAAAIPSTWEVVKGAAGKTWDATKGAADATLEGGKSVAGKTWDGAKGAAGWTWDVVKKAPSKLVFW